MTVAFRARKRYQKIPHLDVRTSIGNNERRNTVVMTTGRDGHANNR